MELCLVLEMDTFLKLTVEYRCWTISKEYIFLHYLMDSLLFPLSAGKSSANSPSPLIARLHIELLVFHGSQITQWHWMTTKPRPTLEDGFQLITEVERDITMLSLNLLLVMSILSLAVQSECLNSQVLMWWLTLHHPFLRNHFRTTICTLWVKLCLWMITHRSKFSLFLKYMALM